MVVKELIELLSKLDQDKGIIIGYSDYENGPETNEIEQIVHIKEHKYADDYLRMDEDWKNNDIYVIS